MPLEPTERQKTILDALISEYVSTAEPVASLELVRKYSLPYSPATVRSELVALDDAGYLTQPHTSAGRIPTDRAYRLFINERIAGPTDRGRDVSSREEAALRELREFDDPVGFAKQASRLLAHLTRSFVLAGFPTEELFYKSGIREVIAEPEFADADLLQGFGALMDVVEDEVMRRFDAEEFIDEPQAFIGGENPIREARRYGMVISAVETPFAKEGLIALIGPKRMDYRRSVALLRHIQELLNT
ncbi:MAG: hypothetical protein HY474_01365 [Candidatus Sungbacteria bacterium]|uniref:Heat-inducible transcription repressor HrcA C-terminal domain-containing protein n=1 Tax=Candidatus Sungiibacteriota bacterium TaxID=2750080 RepID=A0A932YYE1_9BACT|nr:hypothetical protein [Candidatus Sungbacteria bacterium]